MPKKSHAAVVTAIEELAPQIVQVTVSVSEGSFSFEAGQWLNFRFPDGVSRAYTIASAPERPEALQLCVRVGPGRGGSALQKLEAGNVVSLDGPYGDFRLPQGDDRPVVFLAGDTGIAPVRSLVLHMLAAGDPRPITVLYEPDHRHILYAGDFDPLARSGAIVHESGKIETLIARNRGRLSPALLMAVGFDPFLARATATLADAGIDTAGMISESFGVQP